MSTKINRRTWLKSGAMLAAGFTVAGKWTDASAHPAHRVAARMRALNAEAALVADMPAMKARLLANENPFGPSEKAKQAIADAINDSYMYPFMSMRKLTALIAKDHGVTEDHILFGAGSTELLLAAAMHYGMKGETILSADPSYTSLMESAGAFGAKWDKVALTKDLVHDLEAMAARVSDKTSLVYICNPNNPTGTVLAPDKLNAFCETVSKKKPVFVDEAYIDYAPDPRQYSVIDSVRKGQNVIVARTFSKLHAFAGLRIGYVVAQPEVVKQLENYCTGGMNMTQPSIMGAIASYQDREFHAYAVNKNTESKEFLYKTLKDAGYEYTPSHTNFVLFPVRMDAGKFRDEMMKRGVGVRSWVFNNQQWCRVSMGRLEDMKLFADAFQELS